MRFSDFVKRPDKAEEKIGRIESILMQHKLSEKKKIVKTESLRAAEKRFFHDLDPMFLDLNW